MISKSTIFVVAVTVGAMLLIVVTVGTINQTDAEGQPVGERLVAALRRRNQQLRPIAPWRIGPIPNRSKYG